jgi:hypothetical protein
MQLYLHFLICLHGMHRNNFTCYLVYLHLTNLTAGIRLHNSDILYKFLQPGHKTVVNLNSNAFLTNRVLCMLPAKDYIMTKQSTLAPNTTELK